jgi:uncharacterized protein
MMSKKTNEDIHRRQVEAFQRGDLDTVMTLYSNDAVWHLPGKSLLAGDHSGVDAIRTFLTKAVELTQGSFRLELLDAAYSDTNIFQWNRITAVRGGRSLEERELLLFTVQDGKIVEVHHRPEQPALDDFYS